MSATVDANVTARQISGIWAKMNDAALRTHDPRVNSDFLLSSDTSVVVVVLSDGVEGGLLRVGVGGAAADARFKMRSATTSSCGRANSVDATAKRNK